MHMVSKVREKHHQGRGPGHGHAKVRSHPGGRPPRKCRDRPQVPFVPMSECGREADRKPQLRFLIP